MTRIVHPWWQYVPALGRTVRLTPAVAGGAGKVRRLWDAPLAAGPTSYPSYQRIFGDTQFCAPIPVGAPDAIPEDPYRPGRKLDTATNWQAYPRPWFNTSAYNLPTHVVDTSLPPGTIESGGGGYAMQKVYQQASYNYRIKRGGGTYQALANSLPVPLDIRPATGTDESSSVTDVGPAKLDPTRGPKVFEFWHLRKSTGDGTHMQADSPEPGYRIVDTRVAPDRPSNTDGFEYVLPVPVGEWCFVTMGVCEDTALSAGAFDHNKGNVVASGMIGAAFQIGIDEALLACGMVRDQSGAISYVPPVVDAIQHMVGVEFKDTFAQQGFSWPATFHDAAYPGSDQIYYGQRMYFDAGLVDLDAITDRFAKALTWTGIHYGFTGTDKGGNFAFRGEGWKNPGNGAPDPWNVLLGAGSGRSKDSVVSSMPWLTARSLPVDYGKPGTDTAGLMTPIGRGTS